MQFHLVSHRFALAWALLFLISGFSSAQVTPEKKRLSLAELPIQFEPNFGQAEEGVDFLARLPQLDVVLRAQEVTLRMADGVSPTTSPTVRFNNSDKLADPAGSDLRTSQTHYLLGRDPSQWHTHIPNFGESC